jgi:hypothetical protein
MQHSLAPDRQRIAIALVALAIVLFAPAQFGTVLAILVGAISGLVMFRSMTITLPQAALIRSSKTCAAVCAVVLVALLVLLPIAGQITGRLDTSTLGLLSEWCPCLWRSRCPPPAAERRGGSGLGQGNNVSFWVCCGTSIARSTLHFWQIPRGFDSGGIASHCVRAPRTLRPERAWTAGDDSSPAILGNSAQPSVCSECPSWSKCGCCWRPDRSTVHAAVDIYGAKLR